MLKVYYWYYMSDSGLGLQRDSERGWFSFLDHSTLVNRKLVEAFNDAGAEFAFPTQTLYLCDDPVRELKVDLAQSNGKPSESDGNAQQQPVASGSH